MGPPDFPDNSPILFRRDDEPFELQGRAANSGLTGVIARPQMGKSWLLTELARRLSGGRAPDHAPLQSLGLAAPVHFLVGCSSFGGSTPDQMVRALTDLYTRWFASSSFRQQAEVVFRQHQGVRGLRKNGITSAHIMFIIKQICDFLKLEELLCKLYSRQNNCSSTIDVRYFFSELQSQIGSKMSPLCASFGSDRRGAGWSHGN